MLEILARSCGTILDYFRMILMKLGGFFKKITFTQRKIRVKWVSKMTLRRVNERNSFMRVIFTRFER